MKNIRSINQQIQDWKHWNTKLKNYIHLEEINERNTYKSLWNHTDFHYIGYRHLWARSSLWNPISFPSIIYNELVVTQVPMSPHQFPCHCVQRIHRSISPYVTLSISLPLTTMHPWVCQSLYNPTNFATIGYIVVADSQVLS
jgi:hypothetical protein